MVVTGQKNKLKTICRKGSVQICNFLRYTQIFKAPHIDLNKEQTQQKSLPSYYRHINSSSAFSYCVYCHECRLTGHNAWTFSYSCSEKDQYVFIFAIIQPPLSEELFGMTDLTRESPLQRDMILLSSGPPPH